MPEDLVEGEQYVVSIDVQKHGEEEHPQLDPGDLVTLINGTPDADGEVYVTAIAMQDDASIGAWVLPQYLWTIEEAERFVQENPDLARRTPGFDAREVEGDDEDTVTRWEYVPHPDFPNLPTYETLPLGYALGIVQFIRDLGKPAMTPEQAMFAQYLQSRGFPTG